MSGIFSKIDSRSATPVYLQIADNVRRAIRSGELSLGDTLPPVRSLATKLRVNPAAVTNAYRELAREGITESEPDTGSSGVRIVRAPSGSGETRWDAAASTMEQRRSTISGSRAAQLEALTHLATGHVIEKRFEIRRLLGAGAMGAVYLAHDRELDEEVALKVLPPLNTTDETAVKRFLNEIRVARRISHRNVVRTHDVGRWSGGLFLTMEYVPGRTLRDLLDERGTLNAKEAVAIGSQLADALIVAHEQGVIHRDIKPQNLLLEPSGQLKVLDFGIAVIHGTSGQLTEAGLVVGTPAYMAPEQLMSDPVGPTADLYAVGVVLYECLSGVLPYEAATPMALVAQIVQNGPRALADTAPSVPADLGSLVMRLLTHDPTGRFESAAGLRDALQVLAS